MRIRVFAAFVLAVLLCVSSGVAARAAVSQPNAAARPTISLALNSTRLTAGVEYFRVWTYVWPATKGTVVRLQRRAPNDTKAADWRTVSQTRENASGAAVLSYLPRTAGTFDMRVGVGGSATSPAYIATVTASIRVYSYSPELPHSEGAYLLDLDKELCYTIADEISRLSVIVPVPPAYAFAVNFAGAVYKKSECDNAPFAAALRDGFTEAAVDFIIDRFKDRAAEAAWGPELDRILNLAHVHDAFIGAELKQIWNDWLLNAIQQVLKRSAECFHTHKFPAPECAFWPSAERKLEAHMIK